MADNKLTLLKHLELLAVRCAATITSKVAELATSVTEALEEMEENKVSKTGDTMTGDLAISKAIPALTMQISETGANTLLRKNANASVDYGTHLIDTASEGNYTQVTLGHAAEELSITRYENGQPVSVNRIYHEGFKPESDSSSSMFTYGTEDLVAGSSPLENGKLYFVYE